MYNRKDHFSMEPMVEFTVSFDSSMIQNSISFNLEDFSNEAMQVFALEQQTTGGRLRRAGHQDGRGVRMRIALPDSRTADKIEQTVINPSLSNIIVREKDG